ncbi:MAG: efflux RND transporter periplasmic adaptor subunit [Phycisphaerales bacterium]
MSISHTIAIASMLLMAAAPGAQSVDTANPNSFPAVTRPVHDLDLAFPMAGRVKEVPVKPGDRVSAGDLLVRLDDDELEVLVALSGLRAESTAAIDSARVAHDAAEDLLARTQAAFKADGANTKDVSDARTRAAAAQAALAEAELKSNEAKLEMKQFQTRLDRMRLNAPFNGVVELVHVEAGGAIDELAPAVRLVDSSRLKIDVAVPAGRTLDLRVGQTMSVRYRSAAGKSATAEATITSLAEVADAASRTRTVRLEMANDAGLPAGLPVDVLVPAPREQTADASPR